MKIFNTGDVIYSTRSEQVMVIDREVVIEGIRVGCIAQYLYDASNPKDRGVIFSAFISYENYETNYYEILEKNKII